MEEENMDNMNKITIEIVQLKDYTVNEQTYLDILNAMGDCVLPVHKILLNDKEVFHYKKGFIKEENK